MMKNNKKSKRLTRGQRWGLGILLASLVALFFAMGFGLYKVVDRSIQRRASERIRAQAHQAITYVTGKSISSVSAEPDSEDTEKAKVYDEVCPISVNFDYLHNINEDVKGWLYCPDTDIDFEVMYGPDNSYYLYRLLNREDNIYGSIFIDYRNAPDFSDINTLIYGHDMRDGSMFGSLRLYKDQAYYDEHPVLYLLTPEQNYRLEILCGFVHTAEINMYNVPGTEQEAKWDVYDAISLSTFQSKYHPHDGDHFVTLTTCSSDYEGSRYAIICRMVEIG